MRRLLKELRLHCGCWFHDWTDQMAMRAMQALVWVSLCANGIASLAVLIVGLKQSVCPSAASDPAMRVMLEFAVSGVSVCSL